MTGPLEGARVLDLTQGVAGPYATKCFSDYGADVIKIERPDGGDPARRLGPFPNDEPDGEASGMFLHLNTGKRSVALDLRTRSGRELLLALAAQADLVVESFRPGTLERLGIGPDALAEASPAAALVRVSGFGQDGPYRDYEADDMLLYAAGGVMQVTGDPEREPLKLGLYAPLFLAGSVAAGMAMGAMRSSMRDGRGERVDVSIHEIMTASMDRGAPNIVAYQYSGSLMIQRTKNVVYSGLPTGVYPCADGYVQVATQPAWFPRMCRSWCTAAARVGRRRCRWRNAPSGFPTRWRGSSRAKLRPSVPRLVCAGAPPPASDICSWTRSSSTSSSVVAVPWATPCW